MRKLLATMDAPQFIRNWDTITGTGFSLSLLRVRGEKIHKERFQWSTSIGLRHQRTINGKETQKRRGL
jgi:hypothetical protein